MHGGKIVGFVAEIYVEACGANIKITLIVSARKLFTTARLRSCNAQLDKTMAGGFQVEHGVAPKIVLSETSGYGPRQVRLGLNILYPVSLN